MADDDSDRGSTMPGYVPISQNPPSLSASMSGTPTEIIVQ